MMSVFKSTALYLASFGITLLNIHFVRRRQTNKAKTKLSIKNFFCIVILSWPILLVYGLRFDVGIDYFSYLKFFLSVQNSEYGDMEIGYVVLNIIASKIFNDGYGIFVMTGILFAFIVYLLAEVYKDDVSSVFMLYIFLLVYFGVSCNGVRQTIAVTISVYAYQYAMKHKFIHFAAVIVVAALFHKSALFLIPLYFLTFIKGYVGINLFKVFCCLLGFLCIFFQNKILMFIQSIEMYAVYAGKLGNLGNPGMDAMVFLLYVLPVLILIEFSKSGLLNKKKKYQFLIMLMWVQIPIQCCGVFNHTLERMSLYCSIPQIVLIPAIVKYVKDPINRKMWGYVYKGWYLFYFLVMEMYLVGSGIKHYQLWSF